MRLSTLRASKLRAILYQIGLAENARTVVGVPTHLHAFGGLHVMNVEQSQENTAAKLREEYRPYTLSGGRSRRDPIDIVGIVILYTLSILTSITVIAQVIEWLT